MSLHFIEHDAGVYHIYLTDARGHRTRIGPRIGWEAPREAIDFARKLNKAHEVQPGRTTSEGQDATSSSSPALRGSPDDSGTPPELGRA